MLNEGCQYLGRIKLHWLYAFEGERRVTHISIRCGDGLPETESVS